MPPPESLSELANTSDWLTKVFERYQCPLVSYAWRFLNGNIELARDCVQDTFLALCKQPRSAVEDHLEAWLFKTCRNRAIDYQRRRTHMITTASNIGLEQAADSTNDPLETMSQSEEQRRVESAIHELPEREQELLTLRLTNELSYKQIAEITGLSVSNVGFLLHQAISRLRTSLAVIEA
jgi:RNA polymerase sigma-70 factor, ECF subfamily